VPADVRVVALLSGSFRADQSILTGESHPVDKDAAAVKVAAAVYQDKTNMLYSVGGRRLFCRSCFGRFQPFLLLFPTFPFPFRSFLGPLQTLYL
jgi:hypothetical protein